MILLLKSFIEISYLKNSTLMSKERKADIRQKKTVMKDSVCSVRIDYQSCDENYSHLLPFDYTKIEKASIRTVCFIIRVIRYSHI